LIANLVSAMPGDQRTAGMEAVCVLHGLAGCGKTRIALELALWAAENHVDSWWVSAAEGSANVIAGMLTIARQLGATDEQLRHGDSADILWRKLAGHERPWLLIIDGADEPSALAAGPSPVTDGTGWLRPCTAMAGFVVVTSREGDPKKWGHWCSLRAVRTLTAPQGAEVLQDLAPGAGSPADAAMLAGRLGGLPLALRLAGSYLAQTADRNPWTSNRTDGDTYAAYRAMLDQRSNELFNGAGPVGSTPEGSLNDIASAWDLSLNLLGERGVIHARELLRLMSCFGAAPIPYLLAIDPSMLTESPLFAGIDERILWDTMRALDGVGLVDLQQEPGRVVVIHPLVRDSSRAGADVAEHRAEYLALVTRMLGQATGRLDPENPADWPAWQVLLPHCSTGLELLQRPDGSLCSAQVTEATLPLYGAACYLQAVGLVHEAESRFGDVLRVREHQLGSDHPETLAARHRLSMAYSRLGDMLRAETMLRRVLADATASLGADAPVVLRSQQELATVLRGQDKLDESETILRSVLQASSRVIGSDHADTLHTEHELGFVMQDKGDLAEAERIYRRLLRRGSQLRAPDHTTIMVKHSLAYVVMLRGRLDEAERLFRQTLATSGAILGRAHPHTIAVQNNLGLLLCHRNKFAAAQQILSDTLPKREEMLGPKHLDTLVTRHNLGLAAQGLGEFDRAEDIFRSVLSAREEILGKDHRVTLGTASRLGSVLTCRGRKTEARTLLADVLATQEKVLPATHPDIRETRAALDDVDNEDQ
jgi:Tfp pilus assembly protein PilF